MNKMDMAVLSARWSGANAPPSLPAPLPSAPAPALIPWTQAESSTRRLCSSWKESKRGAMGALSLSVPASALHAMTAGARHHVLLVAASAVSTSCLACTAMPPGMCMPCRT